MRWQFRGLVARFKRINGEEYPHELKGYLRHYQDRLFDSAIGWKPLGYEEQTKSLDLPELKKYNLNIDENVGLVAEDDQAN